ncbi:MAG: hypothetical protein LBG19_05610 [Prevotellaceae bacterium]|nr:hypothetical protein [Prevotellaceae bacterium]
MARLAGFSDRATFTRVRKKATGFSLVELRNKLINK